MVLPFNSALKTNLHKADFLVCSFDESLNDVTQTTKIDLYVRYWDAIENRVKLDITILLSLDTEHIRTC